MWRDFAKALRSQHLTARALVDVTQLRGALLRLSLARVHAHKDPRVEVDGEGEKGHDVATGPGGVRLQALQHDSTI